MTPLSHTDKPVTLGSIAQTLGGECFGNANYEVTAFVDPRMCRSDKELVYAIEPAAFGALAQLPAKAAVVSEGIV
ncbi:MAG: hypothetical protein K2X66_07235, partial [Cyanobacteria bacterium]|nr:hypothetical protein [Cyanobacteriota bacterium]